MAPDARADIGVPASVQQTATVGIDAVIGPPLPALTLKAILEFGDNNKHGVLVRGVAEPWFEIMKIIQQDPAAVYQIHWRKWEEIIAGAYTRAGWLAELSRSGG